MIPPGNTNVATGSRNLGPWGWLTHSASWTLKPYKRREHPDWRYAPLIVGVATLVGYLL